MPTVKTAVSLDESLFKRTDELARRMRVPRSRLHSMALEEFLRRKEAQELKDSWNEAYAEPLDEEEREAMRDAEALYWETLEDEPQWESDRAISTGSNGQLS